MPPSSKSIKSKSSQSALEGAAQREDDTPPNRQSVESASSFR